MAPAPKRRVPTRAITGFVFTDLPKHETIWAIAAGPDELVHVAVCGETIGGQTVQLYAYDTAARRMRHALDVAKAIGEDPRNGHATHGKVHFALCPSRDGFVYAATHASTPPLGETMWNAKTMWGDRRRSFSGGHVFRYDPRTGDCRDFGVPFPHVGISAMDLDEERGRLVGVTYPTGHLIFIEKDTGEAFDAGRISETYPLALVPDGKGRVWSSDAYGFLIRIHVAGRRAELLTERVPQPGGATGLNSSMCDGRLGPDGFIYGVGYAVPNLFRFRPRPRGAIRIEDLGPFLPGATRGMARGLCFADDGMLYACFFDAHSASDNIRLVRYDPERMRGESLGLIHVNGASRRWWRCVKGADDRLYAGECGRMPVSMIIIDPKRL